MAFLVFYSREAQREFERLEPPIAQRIKDKLDAAQADPWRFFLRLTDSSLYRLRAGDYRVIAEINRTDNVIFIVKIGHRKNVYDA